MNNHSPTCSVNLGFHMELLQAKNLRCKYGTDDRSFRMHKHRLDSTPEAPSSLSPKYQHSVGRCCLRTRCLHLAWSNLHNCPVRDYYLTSQGRRWFKRLHDPWVEGLDQWEFLGITGETLPSLLLILGGTWLYLSPWLFKHHLLSDTFCIGAMVLSESTVPTLGWSGNSGLTV